MNYPADKLAAFLASPDAGAARYVVSVKGEEAGVVSVRHPWLKGPYLELLALLPQAQTKASARASWPGSKRGLKHGARNLWVCASSFNARALRFYERHGFARAATLPGLVADGYDEILLRKFPLQPARNARTAFSALSSRRRRVGIDVGDVLHVGVRRMIDKQHAVLDRDGLAALQFVLIAILELDLAAAAARRVDLLLRLDGQLIG